MGALLCAPPLLSEYKSAHSARKLGTHALEAVWWTVALGTHALARCCGEPWLNRDRTAASSFWRHHSGRRVASAHVTLKVE